MGIKHTSLERNLKDFRKITLKYIRIEFQKVQVWLSSSFHGNRKITCKKEALS